MPHNIHSTILNIPWVFHGYTWKPYSFRCPNFNGEWKDISDESFKKIESELTMPILRLNQSHSNEVMVIDDSNYLKDMSADAAITKKSWVALWVLTSDCLPIFLYDPKKKIIWVIHAWWKGLQKCIITQTFQKMHQEFDSQASDVKIYIGPHISQSCYEVWKEFLEKFPEDVHFESNKYYLNLSGRAKKELLKIGVWEENIEISDVCTYASQDMLHSYRRHTHFSEENYGNNLGFIFLKK